MPNVLAERKTLISRLQFLEQLICLFIVLQQVAPRLFHHEGERAVAKAAEKYGTMFGISSLSTVSVEEINALIKTPKMFQFYFHKKTEGLIQICLREQKHKNFDVLALTVDTITGGNRERDLRTGFTIPPNFNIYSLLDFLIKPMTSNYLTHEKFELPHLQEFVKEGTNVMTSIGSYFSTMLDQSMNWSDESYVRNGMAILP